MGAPSAWVAGSLFVSPEPTTAMVPDSGPSSPRGGRDSLQFFPSVVGGGALERLLRVSLFGPVTTLPFLGSGVLFSDGRKGEPVLPSGSGKGGQSPYDWGPWFALVLGWGKERVYRVVTETYRRRRTDDLPGRGFVLSSGTVRKRGFSVSLEASPYPKGLGDGTFPSPLCLSAVPESSGGERVWSSL